MRPGRSDLHVQEAVPQKTRQRRSLDYPGSVRWQQFWVHHTAWENYLFGTASVALPHNRVEMLIGIHAEVENKIQILLLSDNTVL